MSKKNIVVFASGSGSNALNLIHYFNSSETAVVNAIFTNNKNLYLYNMLENTWKIETKFGL
jgi:phosphoribosylglycinamide formyltransferase-1